MSASPIAVVGLASLLPGSDDLNGFWESLLEARDCFSDVPEAYWRIEDYFDPTPRAKDKTYGRRGGFIPAQAFDALAFGMPPSSLQSTDVAQLLALLIAQRCMADADNGDTPRFDRSRTGVILGAAATTQLVAHMSGRMAQPMWREGMRRAGLDDATIDRVAASIADQFVPWQESTFPGLLGNVIAGRVANRFNLGGTNCVLDAACASSLAALSMAVNELRSGQTDTVITGGVDALNDILMFLCFSQTPALSLTGDCRPFSDQADGTMLGEGVAMLALRRLEDAERDGHKIYAVIRGIGTSSDGRAKSVYAPRPEGQALALRRAYKDAGYGPECVELMEAHGTGTIAGDAAEFASLREVFGEVADGRTQWCALGSVKSQIGHTKAAAGAASLVKTVLALHHRTLPPTIKVERPNPALELERGPFYLNTVARPWFQRREHPRRASVSSFGFGGSNFHVTLEEYRGPAEAPRLDVSAVRLLLISGDELEPLRDRVAALPAHLLTEAQLAAFARTTHHAFKPGARIRLAILVEELSQLQDACDEALRLLDEPGDTAQSRHCWMRRGGAAPARSVAFVFPGQGSQYLAMGRDLALHFPEAFASWERSIAATAKVSAGEPADLGEVVFPRPSFGRDELQAQEARLRATRWAQPALAAASLAQLALLDRIGLRPTAVTGHSFGELVALHVAGAFDEATLLALSRARGQAMEECAGDDGHLGSMLAVSGDSETVRALLAKHGDRDVVLANDNHPRQAVLSGPVEGLRGIEPVLTAAGLSFQELRVAAAFHSPLVAPAAKAFGAHVRKASLETPRVPVIANATATPYPADAKAVRAQLSEQLARPVRFRESIDALYGMGCRIFVEVGAGSVLTGLVGKCLGDREHVALSLDSPGRHGLRAWWSAVAELSTLGLPLNLAALHDAEGPLAPAPDPPKGPTVVQVAGANLGKPYPPSSSSPRPAPAAVFAPAPAIAADVPQTTALEVPYVESIVMSDRIQTAAPLVVRQDDLQSQILEAQRLTQQAILESFAMALRGLGGAADLRPAQLTATPVSYVAAPMMQMAQQAPVAHHAPTTYVAPEAPQAHQAPVAPVAPQAPMAPQALQAPQAPVAAPQAPVTAPQAPVVATAAPTNAVLSIIADKTGYPVDALGPDMDLEADLGIDSIKRVEILAAVNEKMPNIDASKVSPADIRRISDLLALLEGAPADPSQAATR